MRTNIYTHRNYHIMYVFVGNKNILVRTKICGARYKTIIKCYTETINWFGQELTDTTKTQNAMTVCVAVANEKIGLPKHSVCVYVNLRMVTNSVW